MCNYKSIIKVKKISPGILLILLSLWLTSCNEDEPMVSPVPCLDEPLPLIGEVPEECFTQTIVDERFYVFRGGRSWEFDWDEDGTADIELYIEDGSFGVAGPTRAEVIVIPLQANYRVSSMYTESYFCSRWRSYVSGEDTTHFAFRVDARPCEFYTAEELMEFDTVTVDSFEGQMVEPHQFNEIIDESTEWSADSVFLKKLPNHRGNFEDDSRNFILFRREIDGVKKYGWLELTFIFSYGVLVEMHSYGFMQ